MVKALGPKPEIVSAEEEDLLWVRGVIGLQNPKQLLYSIFLLLWINLCLLGDEHRALKVSQFKRLVLSDPDNLGQETICYEYTEHGS